MRRRAVPREREGLDQFRVAPNYVCSHTARRSFDVEADFFKEPGPAQTSTRKNSADLGLAGTDSVSNLCLCQTLVPRDLRGAMDTSLPSCFNHALSILKCIYKCK